MVFPAFSPQHRPQNAGVGIPVYRNIVDLHFHAEHPAQRGMERVVMHGIAAVQERAVNIKQVSVRRVPAKARTDKSLP